MKRLVLLLFVLSSFVALGQGNSKNDIIVTKDGDFIQAKVVKVTAETISFNYPGETVINEISATSLEKIVFSSGRTQTFDTIESATEVATSATEAESTLPKEEIALLADINENSLAVIPASFIRNDTYSKELSRELSNFISNYLGNKASDTGIMVQEMTQTIRRLVDNGIGYKELKTASIPSLRNALGTEFLVQAELTESQSATAKPGFYGEEQIKDNGSTATTLKLVVLGADDNEEVFSTTLTQEQKGVNTAANGWQSITQYALDQFLAQPQM